MNMMMMIAAAVANTKTAYVMRWSHAMSEQHDPHALNACMARVIGKEVKENACGPTNLSWWYWRPETEEELGEWIKWNPLHDANQMEEVEAWLIEKHKRLALTMHWGGSNWHVTIRVYGEKECEGLDHDKKRACALAIWQMEQAKQP